MGKRRKEDPDGPKIAASLKSLSRLRVVRLKLPAEVESLALVRREAETLGERFGLDAILVADLKTVLSEACGNVVRHAYGPGESGLLEVSVVPEGEALRVLVRDWGAGFGAQLRSASTPGLYLGIRLIGAVSRRLQVRSERGVGTELEVEMSLEAART